MTTTAQLKPGPVWNPEKKKSGLAVTHPLNGILVVEPLEGDPLGWTYIHHPEEFGWENTETVKLGHVQVRVDDLDAADGEKPTSATVTLFCPVEGCGEPVEVGVHLWALKNVRDCYVVSECRGHRCKPPQPDEPTEFGARVTVTLPDGTREKRLRVVNGGDWPWRNGDGDRHFWAYLIERGTVTLGWDDES